MTEENPDVAAILEEELRGIGPEEPPAYQWRQYSIHGGSLYGWKPNGDNHVPFKIANFVARITADHITDDGEEQSRTYRVEASLRDRTITAHVPAKEFRSMNWIAEKLGGMAIIYPGQAEHARAAIQTLSENIPILHSYSSTGWREIEGRYYYLHAGGGIDAEGNRKNISVALEDKLPHYSLPDPPPPRQLAASVHASMQMLDVTLDRLTFPVYAAIWRALLGPATFSLFITGGSGVGKSELAALAQQHFGPAMDADHFPASWQDTANAARVLAFYAKDALLVVDDFVPVGNAASQQKLQDEADKLLRAQGNSAGRRRLSRDGNLLGTRPPRGLILSTGEDVPRGKSLNARLIMLNFPKDTMKWDKLTVLQRLAAEGEFSKALSGFVQWLSPRLRTIQQRSHDEKFMRRIQPDTSGVHMRTPENLYSLRFGFLTFLEFARDIRAISPDESKALIHRAEAAFWEIEIGEAEKHTQNDIARMFLRYVRSAITMGKAYLADYKTGGPPRGEKLWGWSIPEGGGNKQSHGLKIGWVKEDNIYLLPDAAYAVAYQLAKDQGENLPGSNETIKRELKDQKLLARTGESRRTYTIRRTVEGEQQEVLFLKYQSLAGAPWNHADNADNADNDDAEPLGRTSRHSPE